MRESVRRLQAYAEAGADVLCDPGVKDTEEIKVLVEAIQSKPFNPLIVSDIGLTRRRYRSTRIETLTSAGFSVRICGRASIEHELREQNFEIRIETHVLRQLLAKSR